MPPAWILIAAYFLGSIPFGYLIVRSMEGADVRESGSGGTGATNVSRRAGKAAGIVTLLLDAAKGAVAVVLARWLLSDDFRIDWWVASAAFLAVIGHCFPIWLGFRGGKGVATGVGVFLALSPIAVAGAALIFILTVTITRYVSLGSILAAAAFPLCVWLQNRFVSPVGDMRPIMVAGIASGALILLMHHANIARLLSGTESKFR
ncbi:MAG: acyl phosphate:glycerol-3-phosphate acyltransferase [Acidobacteriota bacterium]|jgi:glycerol-3-phosphate acyltransferase PlsY|nr:acyl phosphate:glycerol-3-phosphate acyltransferase [Acidobacteriota bacterium]